jgi:dTMP kinase
MGVVRCADPQHTAYHSVQGLNRTAHLWLARGVSQLGVMTHSVPDHGCLIAFEGGEGAGKSTHLRLAAVALRARGITVVETREPGGTALGAELRRLLMHTRDTPPSPVTELLLYLADRAQHVADVIRPALARREVVLTDRFSASTIAYQGYGRQLDLDAVRRLDAVARQGIEPTLTILLDCPVEVGLKRARGTDRFHDEDVAFHERVRAAFQSFARADPARYRVIDAAQPAEQVHAQVLAAVLSCVA